MNKNTLRLGFFFLFYSVTVFSQLAVNKIKKYNLSEVYNAEYGIHIYENLNFALGGDSVRNNPKGYACQGWVEDLYENGQTLHKGYYIDGQLKVYKNYYDNGQLERSFKLTTVTSSSMQIFYPDGKLKVDIDYHNGNPLKWSEYYNDGQLSYYEENVKNQEYVKQRKSFFENGAMESVFELIDSKTLLYTKIEYFKNGFIKESGSLQYQKNGNDYKKVGQWKTFDEEGKLLSDEIF